MEAAEDLGIRFLGDLQRLELRPGDKFVLMCDGHISRDVAQLIQHQWDTFAGPDVKLLILEDGFKLGAISTDNS